MLLAGQKKKSTDGKDENPLEAGQPRNSAPKRMGTGKDHLEIQLSYEIALKVVLVMGDLAVGDT